MDDFGFKRGLIRRHTNSLLVTLKLLDVLLIGLVGLVAYGLTRESWLPADEYLLAIALAMLAASLVFPVFRLYESWRGTLVDREVGAAVLAWGLVFMLLLLIAVATKTTAYFSRLWMGSWLLGTTVSLVLVRILVKGGLGSLRVKGFNFKQIVIIGCGPHARTVARQIASSPWAGLQVAGFFHDDCVAEGVSHDIDGLPVLGSLDDVESYVREHKIEQVWFALSFTEHHHEKVEEVLFNLRHSTTDIRLVPDIYSDRLLNYSLSEIAGIPVLNLSVSPMEGINVLVKAVEDRVLAGLMLLLLSPLLLGVAIAVKLTSPGPVLFKQLRHGWDGKEIEVWKFRSMVVHEEAKSYQQATKGDARITPIGAFLRRTSLDELPQLFNVLQGRMSIVGPRPHPLRMNEEYMDQVHQYMQRHKVKPGITGWAQINGYRGETETLDKLQKRIEFDLYYIEHWSLWLDLQILAMTVFKGFVHKNAY